MTDKAYRPLPKEVIDVAHRIGLERSTPDEGRQWTRDRFLRGHLNEANQALLEPRSDLPFQVYLLDEGDKKVDTLRREKKRERRKKARGPLSSKQRRELFTIDAKDHGLQYGKFLEIHNIWQKYIDDLMTSNMKGVTPEARLLHADFHGAKMVVLSSSNACQVGIGGLVVQETRHTFKLLNEENRLLTIAKDKAVFVLQAAGKVCKLFGSALRMGPVARSKARMKTIRRLPTIEDAKGVL